MNKKEGSEDRDFLYFPDKNNPGIATGIFANAACLTVYDCNRLI